MVASDVVLTRGGSGVARSFQALRARVGPGTSVSVIDTGGNEMRGTIIDISASSLGLSVGGNRLDLAEDSVLRIEGTSDPLWNGTLIGAGIGAGISGALAVAACSESGCTASASEALAGFVVFWTGVGAGIGLWVDWARKSSDLVYLSPGASNPSRGATVSLSPLIGRNRKGVAVSFSF